MGNFCYPFPPSDTTVILMEHTPTSLTRWPKKSSPLEPHKMYWSSKNPDPSVGTLVLAIPGDAASKVPPTLHFFGSILHPKHKPYRTRVAQCPRCWGYHSPHTCTRNPRCRLCCSSTHTESHQATTDIPRCTNCHGPFSANHDICPLRPSIVHGAVVYPSQSQAAALRRSGSNQHHLQPQITTTTSTSSRQADTQPSQSTGVGDPPSTAHMDTTC